MNHIPVEALWILGGIGLAWLLVFVSLVLVVWRKKAGVPHFESHWGGLGRGLGGWSISWTLVLSLIALVLTFGVVSIAVEIVSPPPSQSDNDKKQEKKEPEKSASATSSQQGTAATEAAKPAERH
jgi:hypothetical protein